ncbi:MAG TPA: D-glycero-beta-D-manno-heptose 1-phosphate adenylyltransferase [Bacteroidales bacterium]|nr:D-glycero-beta-D-manno-heptose 1-phosphate adenylyltransferase [Bacteroidales bacterium]
MLSIEKKILTVGALLPELARLRFQDKKIVFTNGCFDILHRGHVDYLSRAAELGDVFIVGLNSDASVSRLKGSTRPIQDQYSRSIILAALQCVSYVILFDEDTPYNLIKAVQPDILVKGGDYTEISKIVGFDIVTQRGGKVMTIPFVEGFSTTGILEKISKL